MSGIWLPWPPSANRYWRHYRGRMVVSAEAKAYQELAWVDAWAAGLRPIDEPVGLECVFCPPDQRRRDLDNCLKVLIDALQGVAYHDDRQIIELHARFGPEYPHGAVEVKLYAMGHMASHRDASS